MLAAAWITLNHAHTALFGAFGLLAIGLVYFCLRYATAKVQKMSRSGGGGGGFGASGGGSGTARPPISVNPPVRGPGAPPKRRQHRHRLARDRQASGGGHYALRVTNREELARLITAIDSVGEAESGVDVVCLVVDATAPFGSR